MIESLFSVQNMLFIPVISGEFLGVRWGVGIVFKIQKQVYTTLCLYQKFIKRIHWGLSNWGKPIGTPIMSASKINLGNLKIVGTDYMICYE